MIRVAMTKSELYPDHNKSLSLSNTTVVDIFPNLLSWRRSLCSNLGGIDPEKAYRATLNKPRRNFLSLSEPAYFSKEFNSRKVRVHLTK